MIKAALYETGNTDWLYKKNKSGTTEKGPLLVDLDFLTLWA